MRLPRRFQIRDRPLFSIVFRFRFWRPRMRSEVQTGVDLLRINETREVYFPRVTRQAARQGIDAQSQLYIPNIIIHGNPCRDITQLCNTSLRLNLFLLCQNIV